MLSCQQKCKVVLEPVHDTVRCGKLQKLRRGNPASPSSLGWVQLSKTPSLKSLISLFTWNGKNLVATHCAHFQKGKKGGAPGTFHSQGIIEDHTIVG